MKFLLVPAHPRHHGAGDGQRDQHHRARTPHRDGGHEGARLSAQPDPVADPGRGDPGRRR